MKLRCFRGASGAGFGSGFSSIQSPQLARVVLLLMAGALLSVTFIAVVVFSSGDNLKAVEAPPPKMAERMAPMEMVDVLIPVREIEKDSPLDPSMFKVVKKPAGAVSGGVLRNVEQIQSKYARSLIAAFQPVSLDYVTAVAPSNPVAIKIPHGFRATSIKVDATSGVEGWARSGAYVDVAWVTDIVSGNRMSKVIVQNARILSAEREVNPDAKPGMPVPTTVTLLVSDRDANKITLASSSGSLVLHLRGVDDPGTATNSDGTLTLKDLLGADSSSPNGENIEGRLRLPGPGGSYEEWELVNGQLRRAKDVIPAGM
jgi:pilus assembly protein CpaB